jgi:CRISPR-associated protein Cas2
MSRPCLITYDITNPKRLARLHRGLKKFAMPIQYSVFHAELTASGLTEVVTLIECTIDPKTDDVRIYMLPRDGWAVALGRQNLPDGILLTSLPRAFRPLRWEAPETSDKADRIDGAQTVRTRKQALTSHQKRIAHDIESRVQTGDRRGIQLVH